MSDRDVNLTSPIPGGRSGTRRLVVLCPTSRSPCQTARRARSPRVPLRPPSPRGSAGLAKAALAARVDGEEWDLGRPLPDGAEVAIITADTEAGRHILRHSTSHVLAQAVTQLFPGAKFTIGPAIEDGFYYDFDLPDGRTFSDDDLAVIEARMREIIKADQPFVRSELPAAEAMELFADQPYKREIIERVTGGGRRLARRRRGRPRRDGQRLPQQPGVRRHVPRPARAVHVAPRPLQADEGRRRLLAGQREGPDAAAHLRHGVGEQGRARRAPPPPGRGGEARPPQAVPPSSTCSASRRSSAAAWPCGTRRAASSAS